MDQTTQEPIKQIVLQEIIEESYNRKHIDAKIKKEILGNDFMVQRISDGVALLQEMIAGTYYESKNRRMEQLKHMDLNEIVIDVFIGVAYFQRPELFTSVCAQMASRLRLSDKVEAIKTVADILARLCQTDAFDIDKPNRMASLMLVSRIPLSEELIRFIDHSEYLPPMVCVPLELTHNFSSGYLTHNDSLILGSGNHHDGDICLDVLNTMNQVALQLDTQLLSTVEEEPTSKLETQEEAEQWNRFKTQSYVFYKLMVQSGNRLYLTHKVDKRGRIYAQGYHITTQGTPFKKAMLELADEQLVEGVPGVTD